MQFLTSIMHTTLGIVEDGQSMTYLVLRHITLTQHQRTKPMGGHGSQLLC